MDWTEQDIDRVLLKWREIEPKVRTDEEWTRYWVQKQELLEKKKKIEEELNSL